MKGLRMAMAYDSQKPKDAKMSSLFPPFPIKYMHSITENLSDCNYMLFLLMTEIDLWGITKGHSKYQGLPSILVRLGKKNILVGK